MIERNHYSLLSVKGWMKFTFSDKPEQAMPGWRRLTTLEMNYYLGLGKETHRGANASSSQDNPTHHHVAPTNDYQTFEPPRYPAPKSLHEDPNFLELSGTSKPLEST